MTDAAYAHPAQERGDTKPRPRLHPAELRRYTEQLRIVNDAEKQLSMLRCSLTVFCKALRDKYGLPEEFEIDHATGEVFVKVKEASDG